MTDSSQYRCYSAFEYSLTIATAPRPAMTATSLPHDISLETIVSVVVVCAGLVMGTDELQPIVFRVWAGMEEKRDPGGVYKGLEERPGFVDIRAKRKAFVYWARYEGGR